MAQNPSYVKTCALTFMQGLPSGALKNLSGLKVRAYILLLTELTGNKLFTIFLY